LAEWIIAQFPAHRCYVEPFSGAASVLLQKAPSKVEVLGDIYGRIVNVFRVLRDPASKERLIELLRFTPYSEQESRACRDLSADPVEDARRMIVLGHQGHGSTGAGGGKLSGWRRGLRGLGGNSAEEWRVVWEHVAGWGDRLRGVYIEQADAIEVMARWDWHDTLHYVDPPYVGETRVDGLRGYASEMTDDDHRRLAAFLHTLKGAVIVSGYPSPLYDELFAGWTRLQRSNRADKGNTRVEVIWMRNVDHGLFYTPPSVLSALEAHAAKDL